ncbi:MAG: hypothetical protein ACK5WV_15830 [Chryseotalea sp.]|jgi:hypothetical protein|nr:hypothetical protein [Flammeovirgaceae bacterium]
MRKLPYLAFKKIAAKLPKITIWLPCVSHYLCKVNFTDYLKSKKIDAVAFQANETTLFAEWQKEFELMHPNSFSARKLNFINKIRRKYVLKEQATEEVSKPVAVAKPKPIIKPKIN